MFYMHLLTFTNPFIRLQKCDGSTPLVPHIFFRVYFTSYSYHDRKYVVSDYIAMLSRSSKSA